MKQSNFEKGTPCSFFLKGNCLSSDNYKITKKATLNVVFTKTIFQFYQKFIFFVPFKLLFFSLIIFDSIRGRLPNLVGDMFIFVKGEKDSRTGAVCHV